MASLAEIDARRRATPLFQQAIALEQRMTAAIALDTIHEARLRTIRTKLRRRISQADSFLMWDFLTEWGEAIEQTINAAERRASRDTAEAPAMGERRAA